MNKIMAIKKNREFLNAYRRGKKAETKAFVLYYRRNRFGENRLGITVSKKIGNAVTRNRTRRIIREAYRKNSDSFKYGWDIVIVARFYATTVKETEIEEILRENIPSELRKAD